MSFSLENLSLEQAEAIIDLWANSSLQPPVIKDAIAALQRDIELATSQSPDNRAAQSSTDSGCCDTDPIERPRRSSATYTRQYGEEDHNDQLANGKRTLGEDSGDEDADSEYDRKFASRPPVDALAGLFAQDSFSFEPPNSSVLSVISNCKRTLEISDFSNIQAAFGWIRIALLVSKSGYGPLQFYDKNNVANIITGVSKKTFEEWARNGKKCIQLAYGGRSRIKRLKQSQVEGIGRLLRFPDMNNTKTDWDKKALPLLEHCLIPATAVLMQRLPIDAYTLFGQEFLSSMLGIEENFAITDVVAADKVFEQVALHTFKFPPRQHVWEAKKNRKVAFPKCSTKSNAKALKNFEWTEKARRDAEKAVKAHDVKDLKEKLQNMYSTQGVRKSAKKYIHLNRSIAKTCPIQLRDVDGHNLCFFDATLPEDRRKALLASIEAVMDAHDASTTDKFDSAQTGFEEVSTSVHLSTYNRMYTDGSEAPERAFPYATAQYTKEGDKYRLNFEQMHPYSSTELKNNVGLYNDFLESCTNIFHWISETVVLNCADEIQSLELILEKLPGVGSSPFHPWASLVINFKIVTTAHRDYSDKNLCGVLPIGDFIGGELVLYEPGLVVPLQSGDLCVFPSHSTTHFNLHTVGSRTSFVFTTDAALDAWKDKYNGYSADVIVTGLA
ncbi:hypothetical protein EVG20_g9945 [Dentipellis fragilis]|uniref:Uncharacterized protein n=1 Tax=Dentipellis fragilis TaxID=205917 RepID=A0A4Y9XUL9_9AGAM|nr:hypothetical protein EVG20_g9945 [Dentipellis fragilis]